VIWRRHRVGDGAGFAIQLGVDETGRRRVPRRPIR
jgi:hypothetical protein